MASKYWEHRAALRQAAYDRANNKVVEAVSRTYDRAARQLDIDIDTIIRTYQRKTGLTASEAMDFLNGGLPDNYRNELMARVSGITDKRERSKLETLLRTDRYQGRISRLDAIKANARIGLTEAAEAELSAVTPHLRHTADLAYSRTMFDIQKTTAGFQMAGVPRKSLDTILKTKWAGEAFSSRIWQNRDAAYNIMTQAMGEIVGIGKLSQATLTDVRGMVDLTKWAGAAKSKFKNAIQYQKYAANRLIRTESAYVANQTTAIAYDECGIEQYEFIATLDNRTSTTCSDLDGKIFNTADKEIGVNFAPMHPFCRSAHAPVLEGIDRSKMQRAARGKGGKTTKVPRDMNYAEWKRWQDDGCPEIDGWRAKNAPKKAVSIDKSTDLFGKLGEEHYTKLTDIVNKSDSVMKDAWGANQQKVTVANPKYKGVSNHQQGKGIFVDIAEDAKGTIYDAPYRVTLHESLHNMDYANAELGGPGRMTEPFSVRYKGGALKKALKDDYKAYRNSISAEIQARTGYKPSALMIDNAISRQIREIPLESQGLISDLFEGVSGGKVKGAFGHPNGYWDDPGKLPTEAFAGIGDASFVSQSQLDEVVKRMPKVYNTFIEMANLMSGR